MIPAAVSHRADDQDCICLAPDRFLFRLRCARGDLVRVVLHYQDKYLPLDVQDTRSELPLQPVCSDSTLDFWEAELTFHVVCLRYWFALTDREGRTLYYSNCRFSEAPFTDVDDMFDCPQNMREEGRFLAPAWAENRVIYQVFPARFASHRPVPDEIWYKAPVRQEDDLQGSLQGLLARLPHIRELGADVLYLTPIFRANTSHKYDTVDYFSIDPAFGSKEDLKALTDRVHEMGMRIILDGVFNHTSPDFFAFADIREKGPASPYWNWYFIEGYPLQAGTREQKPSYKTFSYYGGMPKLNLKNPETGRYILDAALYWLRECHIDGWRLDVGDEIGHAFWKTFRREIRAEFPEALIIGEVWHFAPDFLMGDEWDTVMNYPFYQAALRLIGEPAGSVSGFLGEWNYLRGRLHPNVLPLLWNLAGSHDTPRLLRRCGGDKTRMKLIAALQLLLPGMPMIYYGDEYAMDGGQDPDCRRGMPWDPARQDADMYAWYRSLIRLRKACPEMLTPGQEEADDARCLLIRRVGNRTQVFHCGSGSVPLEEFAGARDLLTGRICGGSMEAFTAAVF